MRQTLFLIPHELFGWPLFGFGWLLGIWLLVSAAMVIRSGLKQGWGQETWSHLPLVVVMAVVIVFVCPAIEMQDKSGNPIGLPIRGYGVMLLLATVSGVGLSMLRAKQMGFQPELILSLAFYMFMAGILGARVFYVIQKWPEFYHPGDLALTLKKIVNITEGGLVVYGSVIGGLTAGVIFLVRKKLPLLAIGDIIAPGMLVGLALGRIGCFLNGCCYGGVCELPIAVQFPQESPPYIRQQMEGQLHGLTLHDDLSVAYVYGPSSAGTAGLKKGDKIKSIQLPLIAAHDAALYTPELAGKEILLFTKDNREIVLPVLAPTGEEHINRLNFRAAKDDSAMLVTFVEAGSAAARAGLKPTDEITSITLPAPPSQRAAEEILTASHEIRLELEDGRILRWSRPAAPEWSLPVHPTQIYSAISAALLALFLWVVFPFRRHVGEVFAWMITIYPIIRILLEAIRTDEPGLHGTPLTISQWVSSGILVGAVALWIYLETSGEKPLQESEMASSA